MTAVLLQRTLRIRLRLELVILWQDTVDPQRNELLQRQQTLLANVLHQLFRLQVDAVTAVSRQPPNPLPLDQPEHPLNGLASRPVGDGVGHANAQRLQQRVVPVRVNVDLPRLVVRHAVALNALAAVILAVVDVQP